MPESVYFHVIMFIFYNILMSETLILFRPNQEIYRLTQSQNLHE